MAALGGVGAYAAGLEAALPGGAGAVVLFTMFLAAAISSVAGFAFSPICAAALAYMRDTSMEMVTTLLVASIGVQSYCS